MQLILTCERRKPEPITYYGSLRKFLKKKVQ